MAGNVHFTGHPVSDVCETIRLRQLSCHLRGSSFRLLWVNHLLFLRGRHSFVLKHHPFAWERHPVVQEPHPVVWERHTVVRECHPVVQEHNLLAWERHLFVRERSPVVPECRTVDRERHHTPSFEYVSLNSQNATPFRERERHPSYYTSLKVAV